MQINDLYYLENTQENELILGGVSALIGASASAYGDSTLAMTDTDLELRTKKNGVSRLKGTGAALAIGEDPTADVYYALEGFDKVKVKTIYREGKNYDLEIVNIKAIDRPNK
ncbi:hypothetical protein NIES4071_75040 [Calothrix sp. NIES-4071]|nr:hypothetical protein NIES4071_75040 [Calothrix sp. NIES-4071]BAZ61779.1 hypothetical protein NIES4105_74990 [Calothrix sp. NIES-4105]